MTIVLFVWQRPPRARQQSAPDVVVLVAAAAASLIRRLFMRLFWNHTCCGKGVGPTTSRDVVEMCIFG
jgi:hypothetical protein